MHLHIVAVGKIKERFLSAGIAEYEKRLLPYLKLSIAEIAEERRGVHANAGAEAQAIDREGERILAAIPDGAVVVALDVRGKELSSEKLAARLHEWQMAGVSPVVFVIGGDLGISRAVLARADLRLSLSPMTFTHQMVRMIIFEQIYRACRINSGEPYHK
jgi:23S rRNA (pseudouridine1915-N3)-methyltransferase